MLRIDVFPEQARSDAAHEIGHLFDGVLPKRLIDSGIVDQADQVAQLLAVVANAGSRCSRWPKMRDRFHFNKPFGRQPTFTPALYGLVVTSSVNSFTSGR